MGLITDIEKVFEDNMSDADGEKIELTPFQKKKIRQLSTGLADAFIDFLQNQTFQITEMEATVDIEEIRTATPLTGVSSVVGVPATIGGTPGTPDPFYLSKRGGAGGFMVSKGKAYIGPKSANNVYEHDTNNSDLTKVELKNITGRK